MRKDEVQKLAKLARIKVTPEEEEKLSKDLTNILAYVTEIQEVVADLPETPEPGVLKNVLREDADPHPKGLYTNDILEEMPDTDGNYLKVKKIL